MAKLKNLFQDSEDEILKSGILFLIGAVAGSLFNYLYHLSMGRMLGPFDYGILGSLFAIIYLSIFATTAFNLTMSKFSAELHGKNKKHLINVLIRKSIISIAIVGFILLILFILISPFIERFLNLNSISGLIIVGFIAYFSILSSILTGALNGLQKFVWQNSSGFLSSFIKFAVAFILVSIGLGVNGALTGVLLGTIAGIIICIIPLRNFFKQNNKDKIKMKKIYIYMFFVTIAYISTILMISFDQILVKHFFSSTDAGFYTAAGIIAKTIWFGAGFLTAPLFPKIVYLFAKNKDTSKLLRKTLTYTLIISSIGSIAFFIIPEFIVSLLYGSSYSPIINLIGFFGVGMSMFSLSQILINYNLAREDFKFIWIAVISFLLEVVGIYYFHTTLKSVIFVFLSVNVIMLIALIIYNRKDILGGVRK